MKSNQEQHGNAESIDEVRRARMHTAVHTFRMTILAPTSPYRTIPQQVAEEQQASQQVASTPPAPAVVEAAKPAETQPVPALGNASAADLSRMAVQAAYDELSQANPETFRLQPGANGVNSNV